jgi:LacI family transcriptional regulator
MFYVSTINVNRLFCINLLLMFFKTCKRLHNCLQGKKHYYCAKFKPSMEVITLKKISEVLGLSISTVSRALKNHPDISAATKKRVNELADTLEYEPNINAINLRSKKNRVLSLIVPSISGFFYDSFISAVEEESRKNNYTLMILQSSNDAEIEKNSLHICRQNRISGLFVCLSTQTTSMAAFEKFKEADIPLVFFDKVPDGDAYNKICIADEQAAKLAAELLLSKNKKTILSIFGNENLSITRTRNKAYQRIISLKKDVVTHNEFCNSTEEAKKITRQYFTKKQKPDAVFCMSDEILIGVMKSLNELKLNIPSDVAVISLSDGYLPKLYTPEITYIETSGYKLGKLAFTKMMQCLNGSVEPEELYTTSPLVKGGSL